MTNEYIKSNLFYKTSDNSIIFNLAPALTKFILSVPIPHPNFNISLSFHLLYEVLLNISFVFMNV